MELIRVNGELKVDGIYQRLKTLDQRIAETEDKKILKLLSREWWRCWFALHPKEKSQEKIAA